MAKFKLTVPIDASAIESVEKGHPLKVVAVDAKGQRQAQSVRLDGKKAKATFNFDAPPEGLRVLVGPAEAADDQLEAFQNAAVVNVSSRQIGAKNEVVLDPIIIRPPQWEWWLRWCRTFTVRGRIVCPDGSPVPGAKVCAYDVDWFLWWRSTQQVACAMTNANGEFEMKFRWCCGWWPWWWWRLREWQLDLEVLDRITRALPAELRVRPIPLPDPAPDLRFIEPLVGNIGAVHPTAGLEATREMVFAPSSRVDFRSEKFDFARLDQTRQVLANRLPRIAELDALRLWPWFPWAPWFDCAPDLIFRATQDCNDKGTVIIDESPWQTRWNVQTPLDVTLVANKNACCVPKPQPGDECLVLTQVCDVLTSDIGGNVGAPATPAGFANPGSSGAGGDRPFAGVLNIYGTVETMAGADYYEFEIAPTGTNAFLPISVSQLGTFVRSYLDLSTSPFFTWHYPPFGPTLISGHQVYETRQHYEATHPGPAWGSASGRIWVGFSAEQLLTWVTSTPLLADGVYDLRVVGYKLVAGNLKQVDLPICGDKNTKSFSTATVAIDNRLDPDPIHATYPPHPCGIGTVHLCITEPDTDIVTVHIVSGGERKPVDACGQYSLGSHDTVEIEFYVYDPQGHLGTYSFNAWYGNNLFSNLLSFATPTAGSAAGPIPAAVAVGPDYTHVANAEWKGGVMKLTLPADAFPKTCCYTLDLRGYKRTIVSCQENVFAHANVSQYSFMITKV